MKKQLGIFLLVLLAAVGLSGAVAAQPMGPGSVPGHNYGHNTGHTTIIVIHGHHYYKHYYYFHHHLYWKWVLY